MTFSQVQYENQVKKIHDEFNRRMQEEQLTYNRQKLLQEEALRQSVLQWNKTEIIFSRKELWN